MSLEGQPRNDAMSACGAEPHQRATGRCDGLCKRPATETSDPSLGELKGIYLALRYGALFAGLTLVSPCVWRSKNSILDFVDRRATGGMERGDILPGLGGSWGIRALYETELPVRRLKEMASGRRRRCILERMAGPFQGEANGAGVKLRFLSPA